MKKIQVALFALAIMLLSILPANAILVDNLDGTVTQYRYDPTNGDGSVLMWLKNANMAGGVTWFEAHEWINDLNSMNSGEGFAGYNNWRLPNACNMDGSGPDSTYVSGSEMGYMYYIELGNPIFGPPKYTGPFVNLLENPAYWASQEFSGTDGWTFWFLCGAQGSASKYFRGLGWAVRDCEPPCSNEGGDDDKDFVCDNNDNCPEIWNADQEDSDNDGVGDVCDNCPVDANEYQVDLDRDAIGDACDGCPNDPEKDEPGACGCGFPEIDSDGDGTLDCKDLCPNDQTKTLPGVC